MRYVQRYVQGDVVIKPIEALPEYKKDDVTTWPRLDEQTLKGVLAYGEATGHSHQILEEDLDSVTVVKILSKLYVTALKEWTIKHEEHKPVSVPPGIYEVEIAKETDWLTRVTRRVAD